MVPRARDRPIPGRRDTSRDEELLPAELAAISKLNGYHDGRLSMVVRVPHAGDINVAFCHRDVRRRKQARFACGDVPADLLKP